MFRISVETMISSAHRLENYDGPCSNLHGHNWRVKATWETDKQDRIGMTFDLAELKVSLRHALSGLEHANMNKVLAKPTAENLAKLIYTRLQNTMYVGHKNVCIVMVEETPGCKVCYSEPKKEE